MVIQLETVFELIILKSSLFLKKGKEQQLKLLLFQSLREYCGDVYFITKLHEDNRGYLTDFLITNRFY